MPLQTLTPVLIGTISLFDECSMTCNSKTSRGDDPRGLVPPFLTIFSVTVNTESWETNTEGFTSL